MKVRYFASEGFEDFADIESLRAASQRLGLTEMGIVLEHIAPRLHGLPRFVELAGPFEISDEDHDVSYETWEIYERRPS